MKVIPAVGSSGLLMVHIGLLVLPLALLLVVRRLMVLLTAAGLLLLGREVGLLLSWELR